MSFRSLSKVLQNIRRAAIVSGAVPRTDAQLLHAFVEQGDQACFDALVRRYGSMVYGVCWRILRHTQDAEDAFQTTFLVLVRKAGRLQRHRAIHNWLYGVAYRTALHARAVAARRRRKEGEVQPMDPEPSTLETAAQMELHAVLDRELCRLPEKYRAPIILCELMGKTKKQAAVELRCPEGTVSSRLARGREMLRRRLGHYGPTISAAVGAVLVQQASVQAVPLGLYASTLSAAVLVAQGKLTVAGGLTPSVATLLQGVLNSMLLSKLKIVAVVAVLAASLVGGGATLLAGRIGEAMAPVVVAPAQLVKSDVPAQARKDEKPRVAGVQRERLRFGGQDFNAWRDILLTDLKPEVRIEAITALGAFGANGYAEEATAAILETMKKYDATKATGDTVLNAAAAGFVVIGPKAFPSLAKELKSDYVNSRRLVTQTLGRVLSAYPNEALPLFLRAFRDDDRLVRNTALHAIVPNIGVGSPLVETRRSLWGEGFPQNLTDSEKQTLVSILIAATQDHDAEARLCGVLALGWFGPEARAAVPALIKLIEESSGPLPFQEIGQATITLGHIGPTAKEAVPSLMKLVKHSDKGSTVRRHAIAAIGKMGSGANDAIPLLISICEPGQWEFEKDLVQEAIVAVGNLGPSAKDAVPVLLRFIKFKRGLNNPDSSVIQAVISLGNIGPAAKEAVPTLVEIENAFFFGENGGGRAGPALVPLKAQVTIALKKIQQE